MGFYLGGTHDKAIDKMLEFIQEYLTKEGVRLSKMHTMYFMMKYTALHMLGEDVNWEDVLKEVQNEIQLNEQDFESKIEEILNRFRTKIVEKIKRGEII